MSVQVGAILERKGSDVVTVASQTTLADAARRLAEHGIGALVVSDDGRVLAGIVSERDIVRRLAAAGADCLRQTVGEVMSSPVTTCTRATTTDELMSLMTESRIRHVPVVEDGQLVGIVSIGDVVKSRIDELEIQSEALREYVTGSGY